MVHVSRSHLLGKNHRANWIRSLIKSGRRPEIVVLARVAASTADAAERFWIAYFRAYGARLVNLTDGGLSRTHLDPEVRRKHSKFMREYRASLTSEQRGRLSAKLSAAKKGRPPTPSVMRAQAEWRQSEAGRLQMSRSSKQYWSSIPIADRQRRMAEMRAKRLGRARFWSEASRRKLAELMRIRNKTIVRTPEAAVKRGEAIRRFWANLTPAERLLRSVRLKAFASRPEYRDKLREAQRRRWESATEEERRIAGARLTNGRKKVLG